ncbi:serine/threonine-protein kinase [Nocardiopsis changdeensis]|uniref:serine/threonine-protein kinase n=1 Tax=Nocardiopsis TaxID=2013 RepID=UPI0021049500|nr:MULTISPECIES: serine/threonine-protein kinase [Nocardiopsis]
MNADTDADPPWPATAYIPGPTLHRAVTDHGPLPQRTVAVLGAGLAEGLAAVHAQKPVHRDLKPGNVLLAHDGPRLIDFGIARALDSTSHTHSSAVLGTAAFMSPEQARAEKVGPASDVFSLGSVLAFAATGRSPFGEGAPLAVMFRLVQEEPDLAGVPGPLVDLVRACLAKDPASRPGVGEVLTALAAAAPSPSDTGGRWLPEDITKVLARYTLAYTRVQEPRTPAAPGRAPSGPKDAELVIGNFSAHPMEVLVGDTVLGTVPRFASGAFHVAPEQRSLLVRTEDHGASQRIALAGGAAVKLAFDLPSKPRSAPEVVEKVVFTGKPSLERALDVCVIVLFICAISSVALGLLAARGVIIFPEEALPFALFVAIVLGALGLLLALLAIFVIPGAWPALVLSTEGLTPVALSVADTPRRWADMARVSLVGEGKSARVVVWPRRGRPPLRDDKWMKDYQGGKVVCRAGQVRAVTPLQVERLRAALRWFAGDLWVERPSTP